MMINERGKWRLLSRSILRRKPRETELMARFTPFLHCEKVHLLPLELETCASGAESHYSRGMFPENILCLLWMFRKMQSFLACCY